MTRVVVADTSPLNYLVLLDQHHLLRQLYGSILIPRAVREELGRSSAPPLVRTFALQLPSWVLEVEVPPTEDQQLLKLGPGERDAISYAEEIQADLLIIDERAGTTVARSKGLTTVGTLGVLALAHELGLVDARQCYQLLIKKTSFRHTDELRRSFFAALSPTP